MDRERKLPDSHSEKRWEAEPLLNTFEQDSCALGLKYPIAGQAIPQPYQDLLVHNGLMTATLERFYGARTILHVLEEARHGNRYARKILLALQGSNRIVEYAVMEVKQDNCVCGLWDAIIEAKKPLGRILIENHVKRRVQPQQFFQLMPGIEIMAHYKMTRPTWVFGRITAHFWDGKLAAHVLEVLPPDTAKVAPPAATSIAQQVSKQA